MMDPNVLKKLKGVKTLDQEEPMEWISCGCYALNNIISGNYKHGIPIGGIMQLKGNSSTGKTLFATTFLAEAQKEGWYVYMLDAEDTFNKDWAAFLGINPVTMNKKVPVTLEGAFEDMDYYIKTVREDDKETPILIVLDSLPALSSKEEYERENIGDHTNTDGARRAKIIGHLLKAINSRLKSQRATLCVINQIRHKINTNPHANPETNAAGGMSLEYYLSVDLSTISNKTSNVQKEGKRVTGIKGRIVSKKNKIGRPFRECDFHVVFDKGLDKYYGLEELLAEDGFIDISPGGRRSVGSIPFKKDSISQVLFDNTKNNPELHKLREMFGINLKEASHD